MEIAQWLLDRRMDANARATSDAARLGGQTALFHAVVSFPNFWTNRSGSENDAFARLLLDRGADPSIRASLREEVEVNGQRSVREHRDITALEWGEQFRDRRVVNEAAMRLLES